MDKPIGGPVEFNRENAVRLLDKATFVRKPCDLDLLLFFIKHPRSLLSSESLTAFLGYSLQEIADSIDSLISAQLLERRQSSAHAARLYTLASIAEKPSWLEPLIEFAGEPQGRLLLRELLKHRPEDNGHRNTTERHGDPHSPSFVARESYGRSHGRPRRRQ